MLWLVSSVEIICCWKRGYTILYLQILKYTRWGIPPDQPSLVSLSGTLAPVSGNFWHHPACSLSKTLCVFQKHWDVVLEAVFLINNLVLNVSLFQNSYGVDRKTWCSFVQGGVGCRKILIKKRKCRKGQALEQHSRLIKCI